jgi:formylmethanofuran dehydrogenase subunit D
LNSKWSDVSLNHDLIEKSMKMYKMHQNICDIDAMFIKKLNLEEGKVEFLKEVVVKMKTSF